MHFRDTAEEAAFRAEARAFLEAHATPRTGTDADWSRDASAADPATQAEFVRRCRAWAATLYDAGWAGITWPRAYGGRGGTPAQSVIFSQEAAAYDVTLGFVGAAQQLVGPPLLRFGSDAQRERFLRPLLRGDEMWCQLFSEPGAGSDLAALSTRAVPDGDGWRVSGQKVWTSGAQHADFGILLARTDPERPKHKGITFFIVDMRSDGVEVRPLVQATGLAHFNEVFLTDVAVRSDAVVGDVHGGWAPARATLASEAGMIGGAGQSSGYDAVLAAVRAAGRTDDPLVRQELARVWTHQRLLEFLRYRMQSAILAGRRPEVDPSVLKNLFVAALAHRVETALDATGAAGMLDGIDAVDGGFWQRQVTGQFASRIGGGTTEVHRTMIGERALGLPAEPRTDKDVPWVATVR
ncbi:MAG: acyl-CoA dehydrogenase family protein [Acidimicrobiia bacterium]|nr:acyl-CoA dehydrogenase family protein [Acidimicrobiia bacterium]